MAEYTIIGIFVKILTLNHKMAQKRFNFRILMVAGILVVASSLFLSCEQYIYDPPVLDPDEEVFFAADIVPIFTAKCTGCHGGSIAPDLRADKAYASLVTDASPATRYVNTASPETSGLYTKLLPGASHDGRSTGIEQQMILKWIQDGALNN
jgi:hypothetical protein